MRRVGILLLALLTSVTAAGCTDDRRPEAESATASRTESLSATSAPPTPLTASPSQSPRAAGPTEGPDQDLSTAPEPPAALTGPTSEESAADVAVYFLRSFPYAASTGDLTAWEQLSGPACQYCEAIRQAIDEIYSAGNRSTGGAIDVGVVETQRRRGSDTFIVTLTMRQYPSQTLSPTGEVIEDFPDTKVFRPLVEVQSTPEGWVVTGVQMDRVA
ncbi:DUF6318 family protein [Cellulomonas palmilytica]|uniref:DUF6318 family protein n=1 Tax=Cellulomonas palmilytica TaxID=2608402 RepID=UPI001F38B7BC|nr:DUF6318 family protein [Cellulomonas palmilytica]UJP39473.1 hypothetical protein F1D97_14250 [Cellulomonas palmilytica]